MKGGKCEFAALCMEVACADKTAVQFLAFADAVFFARAAAIFWQCSLFHQSGPSEDLRLAME
jgi:hypothetical protein